MDDRRGIDRIRNNHRDLRVHRGSHREERRIGFGSESDFGGEKEEEEEKKSEAKSLSSELCKRTSQLLDILIVKTVWKQSA